MPAPASGLPDWRDSSAYRFDALDRPGFAWEWLRREPAYRLAAVAALAAERTSGAAPDPRAASWGLVAFVDPMLAAPLARPLWRADRDASVLSARATHCTADDPDAFILDRLDRFAALIEGDGVEHLLLTDGWRHARVDVTGASVRSGPVLLHWQLAGLALAAPRVLMLRRFLTAGRHGSFPRRLWPGDPRARRWTLALRAHDALATGALQRDIAAMLSAGTDEPGWRIRHPTARLQAQRLVALARGLEGRGFADRFLGGVNSATARAG